MNSASSSRAERYLRFSHRGMVVLLALALLTGTGLLATALAPDGAIARGLPWLSGAIPVAMILVVAALVSTLRGDRWDPAAPEAQAILADEWRQRCLTKAARVALGVVIGGQAPLAFLLRDVVGPRGVWAMAGLTASFGAAAFIALFLFFQHQEGDDGRASE